VRAVLQRLPARRVHRARQRAVEDSRCRAHAAPGLQPGEAPGHRPPAERAASTAALSRGAPRAEFLHVKPGKGAAFVRTKLKNFITGNVVDRTFRGGESVDAAVVEKKETQFSYVDGDDVRPTLP